MLRALRAELFKLKRARALLWTFAVVATFTLMMTWGIKLTDPGLDHVTWKAALQAGTVFMAGWWGVIVYSLVAAHIFGSEYSDNTAATLLTIPVRREHIVAAKFVVLALWVLALALFSVLTDISAAAAMGAKGFSWDIVWTHLGESMLATLILFLTLPLMALLSMVGRGYMAPMLFASGATAVSMACGFLGWTEWFPWGMSATIVGGMGPPGAGDGTMGIASWAILVTMFVAGVAAVVWYVRRADTPT